MNSTEKAKLKHDFLNAIVVINSLTKSASSFINKIASNADNNDTHMIQMEKFVYSMISIREQTARIEQYFQTLLNE